MRVGGKYEGYKPVCQGDGAGPHVETSFLNYIRTSCEREGWAWEPQAAQMPHINVLDLAVFPCISKRHCSLSRKKGGLHVLKENEIWETALEVWKQLPNCKIARGYALSYRIAQKVIDNEGDNAFLGKSKGLSSNIKQDFNDTHHGIARKDGKVIAAPPVMVFPPIFPEHEVVADEGGRGGG